MEFELLTLGHGTATAQELAALIRRAGIEMVVDVRKIPKSRRHPQFFREEMAMWIPNLGGSMYRWEPALGGFRRGDPASLNVALRNPTFRAFADYMESDAFALALRGLMTLADNERVAILCSETLWWRCHRRFICDAATLLYDARASHLMHDGKLRPHVVTGAARRTELGRVRYDVVPSVLDVRPDSLQ